MSIDVRRITADSISVYVSLEFILYGTLHDFSYHDCFICEGILWKII